ncbi:MAG: bifunctional riboflavin kinase/FAD synthetase [Actinomycetes bacterium]
MIVLKPGSEKLAPGSSVVSIGVYDGVHLGHRHTLRQVIDQARSSGRQAVVATFDQHPAFVVRPENAPRLLCDLDQRLELLEEVGVDVTAVISFDAARAAEEPEAFISSVLVEQLGASRVVVGEDFRFGAKRRGDVALLRAQGVVHGFDVVGVVLDTNGGEPVSSTRIRRHLAEGKVAEAAVLLGRVHELRGPVLHGDGRGGPELGCPTANVHVDPVMAIPGVGIYAGWYRDDELGAMPVAISVGRRPTFYESSDPLIEAHLIDFDGDLYGRSARVSFLTRIRDEVRFDSVDALIEQMQRDVEAARRMCEAHGSQAPGS